MTVKKYSGDLLAEGLCVGIVVSRWHEFINDKLLDGSLDTLKRHGNSLENVDVYYVPGSFEIPVMTKRLTQTGKYDTIIALGTIIRGSTLHFDLIANEVVKGIASISLETGMPISLGVLTADTLDQAFERAGSKHGNKGVEATLASIEMANIFRAL
jgi:6,7-dimethyl-8-ribityllumazine synthase